MMLERIGCLSCATTLFQSSCAPPFHLPTLFSD